MLIYPASKRYKERWRVEERLKTVITEAAIKTVQDQIRRNLLWKQKIMFRELNISTQSSSVSSGTIYTW
jgi:hypothetical protein